MLHGSDFTLTAMDYGRGSSRGRIKQEIAALGTSGCPRVPVVGTEWIVVIILKIESFSVLRGKRALSG